MVQGNVTASGASAIERMGPRIGDKVRVFRSNKSGAAAVAYALLAGLIALATIPAADMAGSQIASLYSDIAAAFDIDSPDQPDKPGKPKKPKKPKNKPK